MYTPAIPDETGGGPEVVIPPQELTFTFTRSSGPGGQNVNKTNTRVTLLFDVRASQTLSAAQKSRVLAVLASRINRDGVLRVVASRYRTQAANRNAARDRLHDLLNAAIRPPAERVPTAVPARAKRRRHQDKAHRARLKDQRRQPQNDD